MPVAITLYGEALALDKLITFAFMTDATLKTFGWVLFLDKNGAANYLARGLGFEGDAANSRRKPGLRAHLGLDENVLDARRLDSHVAGWRANAGQKIALGRQLGLQATLRFGRDLAVDTQAEAVLAGAAATGEGNLHALPQAGIEHAFVVAAFQRLILVIQSSHGRGLVVVMP